jgi:hypothetical protein
MSNFGWDTLTTRDALGDTTLYSGVVDGLHVDAKTARNGAELVLRVMTGRRVAHFLIDPETLSLQAMTAGDSDEDSYAALQAVRRGAAT